MVPECKPEWNRETIMVLSRLPSLMAADKPCSLLQPSLVINLKSFKLVNNVTMSIIILFTGFSEMYFFLAFFGFISIMSIETWLQVKDKGTHGARERYSKELKIAYKTPFIWTAIAGIFEAFGPECSKFRPDFDNNLCYFASKNFTSVICFVCLKSF